MKRMKRQLRIVLDNGGGCLADAMRTVNCSLDGDVMDGDAVSDWLKEQIKLWTLSPGDTIRIQFTEPMPPDEFSKM